MTLGDFITLWTGQTVSFPNCEDGQCMTLIHRFCSEVLGIEDPAVLSQPFAADVFINFSNVSGSQYFTKITNTPEGVPLPGDIVVWGMNQTVGIPVGHIAIFLQGDVNSFTSFDANFPTGSMPHKQIHDYTDVLGWLRFNEPTTPNVQVQEQLKTQLDAVSTCQAQLKSATDQVTTLQTQLISQTKEDNSRIVALQNSINDLQSKYAAEQEEVILLNDSLSSLTQTNKDYAFEAQASQKETSYLKDYLYAIADRLKVKRSGIKDADIAENILQSIGTLDALIKTANQSTDHLQEIADTVSIPIDNQSEKNLVEQIIKEVRNLQKYIPVINNPTATSSTVVSSSSVKPTNFFAKIFIYVKNFVWT